jgi:tRNA-specific 2-thiouridylase
MAKVLVGLSGGVDSAVVAALLKQQGHEVFGYTLKLLETTSEDSEGCCTFKDIRDARMVCDQMGIEYLVTNWKQQFKKNVIDRYLDGAKQGIVYNPCVTCNSTIKLPVLAAVANHFGCEYIATGHYARVNNGRITKAKNLKKDQSYFLWETPASVVSRLIFPLGDFDSKDDTRALAREFGLHVADKKDSTDLCFLGGGTKEEFLERNNVVSSVGNFIDVDGKIVGKHEGFTKYVAGQRTGVDNNGRRRYVLNIVSSSGDIMVGSREQASSRTLFLTNARIDAGVNCENITAIIRYHSAPVAVETITNSGDNLQVTLRDAVFGAAKGQSCVFYHGDEVVGGGVIS